jgi:RNA polymerase sigma factor (sigma-70 family)
MEERAIQPETADAELLRRIAAGDLGALEDVYVRHAEFVRRVLVRYCGSISATDVPDLVQDVFLAVVEAAPRYHEDGKFRAWLCGIAIRKASHARRSLVSRSSLLARFGFGVRQSEPRAADEAAMNQQLIAKALARLPEPQRQVLLLHTVEHMSGEEIATALGINEKTVWTRLHRARVTMQDHCRLLLGAT